MKDSTTLNSYSELKGYMWNTVINVKKEWVCIIVTSKAVIRWKGVRLI